ncbi:MAG: prepilin peptidase [Thermoactinomycetaceae bacterium]|jgi:leader peptidase (prepilin peptidase)/N-methyltransferase|nr:prepilin peptidase [Bacillota bacterium]MBO2533795.1 prepilin peptidase [Thermoactinomycetaceae bacterium]
MNGVHLAEHFVFVVLIIVLIFATITDLRERLIYDRFVLVGLGAVAAVRFFFREEPWWDYLLTGVGVTFALATVAVMTGGKAIGGGDIKVFGLIGLALGFEKFLLVFILSHLLAALYILARKLLRREKIKGEAEIPFAPYILAGLILSYGWIGFLK